MDLDFTDVSPSAPPTSRAPFPSTTNPSSTFSLPHSPAKQATKPLPGAPNTTDSTPPVSKFKNRSLSSLGPRTKSGELPPVQQHVFKVPAAALRGGGKKVSQSNRARSSENGARGSRLDNPLSRGRSGGGREEEARTSEEIKMGDEEEVREERRGSVQKGRTIYDAEEPEGFGGSQERGIGEKKEDQPRSFEYSGRDAKRVREELEDEVDERRKRRNDGSEFQNYDEEPEAEDLFSRSPSPVLSPSSQPTPHQFPDLARSHHFQPVSQQYFSHSSPLLSVAERFPGSSPHLQQAEARLVGEKGSKWEECTEEEWKAGGEELSRKFGELMGRVVELVSRKNARATEMREVTRGWEKELEERETKMLGTSKNMKSWAGELWGGLGK